ncbi:hypothetical protein L1887_53390 [Cichorium endivia]|nr:hypothetical protein L1887_53390 [Cichorium endivia]
MASDEDSAKDELGDSCKTYIKNVSDARRLRCDGMCAKWDKMVIVTDDQLSLADGRAGLGHSAPKRMPRSATRALRALDNWIPQDEVMSSVATIRTLCGRCLPLSYCFRPRCGATDEKMLPLSPPDRRVPAHACKCTAALDQRSSYLWNQRWGSRARAAPSLSWTAGTRSARTEARCARTATATRLASPQAWRGAA